MSSDIVDLEELVRQWVDNYPLDPDIRRNLDEIKSKDIDWTDFWIKHGPTKYSDQLDKPVPKTNVLYTAYFTNDTEQPQVYALRSQRSTTSVCNISMEKTFTKGYEVNLKLSPPNPVVEANAGFKGEMSVKDSNTETFVETLVWSVDSKLKVPSKHIMKAELVMTENEHSSNFKVETRFRGFVAVFLHNKKNGSLIMKLMVRSKDFLRPELGFRVTDSEAFFESFGKCNCRFGIEQKVVVHQDVFP